MKRTTVENRSFRVTSTGSAQLERIEYRRGRDWEPIGKVRYHVRYWRESKGKAKALRLALVEATDCRLVFARSVPGLGEFRLGYHLPAGQGWMEVTTRFVCHATKAIQLGFYAPAIDFPDDCEATRLVLGCHNGFTRGGASVLFSDAYDDARGARQAAFAVDMAGVPKGTTRTAYQYLVQSFPPAYLHGAMELTPGEEVHGGFSIQLAPEHIWDPVLQVKQRNATPASSAIEPPRFSLSQYIKNWECWAQEKDLWVPLGKDMGMNHVGFYGMLKEPKIGGPYGWSIGGPFGWSVAGRPVRYREVWEHFHGRRRGEKVVLRGFQENRRTLEIGWGNGGNAMAAYAYFLHDKPWSIPRAKAILNAILGLEGRGFQIPDGPLAGAWINSYDADGRGFQDHYGGQQVFLPDQGIVNYFLARCYLEGFSKDRRIVERIQSNCDTFLSRIESRYETYPNAFSQDGSIGYSREGRLYNWPNAPALALTMLSFLCCYELTGERKQLARAEDMLRRWLRPRLDAYQFGFLEYDHAGWDSAGACDMLIALGQYLANADTAQKPLARRLENLVYEYLMSFRHEHDYFLPAHSKNVLGWGAVAKNKFGFMHGFSPGSSQGMICLHLRYEYGYALMKAFETEPSARRYAAFMNYLNYYTYQQFVNRALPMGFGGCTEHTALAPYVQDTTHLIHSTPLPMIAMERWPLYVSQCDAAIADIHPCKGGLELQLAGLAHLTPESLRAGQIAVDGKRCPGGMTLTLGEHGRKTRVKLTGCTP